MKGIYTLTYISNKGEIVPFGTIEDKGFAWWVIYSGSNQYYEFSSIDEAFDYINAYMKSCLINDEILGYCFEVSPEALP